MTKKRHFCSSDTWAGGAPNVGGWWNTHWRKIGKEKREKCSNFRLLSVCVCVSWQKVGGGGERIMVQHTSRQVWLFDSWVIKAILSFPHSSETQRYLVVTREKRNSQENFPSGTWQCVRFNMDRFSGRDKWLSVWCRSGSVRVRVERWISSSFLFMEIGFNFPAREWGKLVFFSTYLQSGMEI